MSREHGPVGLALEWSPRGVAAYDHATRQTRVADDLASLGLKGREAVLALSRRGVFVRTARVPNAGANDVRLILMMQVGDLFPLPPIDLAWNFALTDDVNDEGRLAILAAVPCADLRRALDAASTAGVRIVAAVPLAVGSIAIAQEMGLVEAAVVERADDGPAVDVVSHGSLRASRATPDSVPLEMEVTRALGLAGLEGVPIIAAGGADVPSAGRSTDRTALMALAETSLDRLNLKLELPEAMAAQAAVAARKQRSTALLTLAAAALVALYAGLQYSDAATAAAKADAVSGSRLQKIKDQAKRASSETSTQVAMGNALEGAFRPAQRMSDILTLVTQAVPKGAWLNTLSIERGKAISVRGTATSTNQVSEFMGRLDANGRFRDIQLPNVNNSQVNRQPVTVFVVQAFPIGNLPFQEKPGVKTVAKR